MDIRLNEVETRVLGSLVEKEITTPDYYPLSLNALINACNQKSNRDPLMNLDEDAVREALHGLNEKGLAGTTSSADSRVTKYEHRLPEAFNFNRRETAILCVLLLRGPQTPGELRGRSERMHRFDDLSEVQSTLQRLSQREPALVKMMPRQPGTKEARYRQLFSEELEAQQQASAQEAVAKPADHDSIMRMEEDIARLQQEVGLDYWPEKLENYQALERCIR